MEAERAMVELLRDQFSLFAMKAFRVVNPGQEFFPTFASMIISKKLAEVQSGQVRRLLINVPPRSGKSLLASIAFPAFVLGQDPTRRIICASYSGELAAKLARDCRTLMTDPFYRRLFPGTVLAGKNTETEIETGHGGFRYSTSVGGTLTGRGGNFIIIDDPMKPDEAMSDTARERVWEWYTGTLGSRLDNKSEDSIIVVMQRLHVDDLAGRLLEQGGWEHVCIPAMATKDEEISFGAGRLVRKVGDVLDPHREPLDVLNRVRRELGSATFEAQYQQDPVPEEGGLIRWSWFNTYDERPLHQYNDVRLVSWDTALKDEQVNDYSVAVTGLVKPGGQVFIQDVFRERMEFPILMQRVREMARRNQPCITLIEDTGSGTTLLQSLRGQISMIGMHPRDGKVVRLNAVSPKIEAGEVYLPKQAPWLDAFKRELLSFPKSRNDDQVDAFTQLLTWVHHRAAYGPLQGRYSAR